jgi:hypothetical protein
LAGGRAIVRRFFFSQSFFEVLAASTVNCGSDRENNTQGFAATLHCAASKRNGISVAAFDAVRRNVHPPLMSWDRKDGERR